MVVSEPTVSGVVLLVPQHLHYFCNELIPNLSALTTPFDEVLVIASGLSRRQTKQVEETLATLSNHPRKRVLRVQLGSVGANRNHGLNNATSDFVSFLDSDDLYSPEYCAFLKSAYEREPYQVLLHSFITMERGHSGDVAFDLIGTALSSSCWVNEDFCTEPLEFWQGDPKNFESTSLRLRNEEFISPIHQGHMTVSRNLSLRFHEDPLARNEDGIFLQECLSNGYQLHFYPVNLSAYRLFSSANPWPYRALRRMVAAFGRSPLRK
jgi:glycosyltransferase involved in cell wall biosynthesis